MYHPSPPAPGDLPPGNDRRDSYSPETSDRSRPGDDPVTSDQPAGTGIAEQYERLGVPEDVGMYVGASIVKYFQQGNPASTEFDLDEMRLISNQLKNNMVQWVRLDDGTGLEKIRARYENIIEARRFGNNNVILESVTKKENDEVLKETIIRIINESEPTAWTFAEEVIVKHVVNGGDVPPAFVIFHEKFWDKVISGELFWSKVLPAYVMVRTETGMYRVFGRNDRYDTKPPPGPPLMLDPEYYVGLIMDETGFKKRYEICNINTECMYEAIMTAIKLGVTPPPSTLPFVSDEDVRSLKDKFIVFVNSLGNDEDWANGQDANALELEVKRSKEIYASDEMKFWPLEFESDEDSETFLQNAYEVYGKPQIELAGEAGEIFSIKRYKAKLIELINDSGASGDAEKNLMKAFLAANHEDIRMDRASELYTGVSLSEHNAREYFKDGKHLVVEVGDHFEVLSKVDVGQDPNLVRMRQAFETIRTLTDFRVHAYSCELEPDCMYKAVATARTASLRDASKPGEPVEDDDIGELKRLFKEYINSLTIDLAKIETTDANALEKEFAKSKTDFNETGMKVFIEEHDFNQHDNIYNNAVNKYGEPRVLLAVAANNPEIDDNVAEYRQVLQKLVDSGDPPGDAEIILMNAFLASDGNGRKIKVENANVLADRVAKRDLPDKSTKYIVVGVGDGFRVLGRNPVFAEQRDTRGNTDRRPRSAAVSVDPSKAPTGLPKRPSTAPLLRTAIEDRLAPLVVPDATVPLPP